MDMSVMDMSVIDMSVMDNNSNKSLPVRRPVPLTATDSP